MHSQTAGSGQWAEKRKIDLWKDFILSSREVQHGGTPYPYYGFPRGDPLFGSGLCRVNENEAPSRRDDPENIEVDSKERHAGFDSE